MMPSRFHMSLPCTSVLKTKEFYTEVIGARIGRNSSRWIDVDLFGNQITFTRCGEFKFDFKSYKFEETVLPAFHFGVIIDRSTWDSLYNRLNESEYDMTREATFLKDKKGEHTSFFIRDPNGHTLEFKTFKIPKDIFS